MTREEKYAEAIHGASVETSEQGYDDALSQAQAMLDGLTRSVMAVADAEREEALAAHFLANGGCVPKGAYDDACAALTRVEELADEVARSNVEIQEHREEVGRLIAERDEARAETGVWKAATDHNHWAAQEAAAERDEARAALARVEALAGEWDQQGAEAEAYILRAHHDEVHEVMAEARWFPERAKELRAALGPQPVHPAGDGEHVHVCVTCGQTHNGRGWVTP